jgi:hypothetical protein
MPVGRHSGANVHPMQQTSAHEVSQRIGIVGKDDLGVYTNGFGRCFRFHRAKIAIINFWELTTHSRGNPTHPDGKLCNFQVSNQGNMVSCCSRCPANTRHATGCTTNNIFSKSVSKFHNPVIYILKPVTGFFVNDISGPLYILTDSNADYRNQGLYMRAIR